MVINYIWNFLEKSEKKTFVILICLSVIVLLLEIISISTIFPFIYSLIDNNFLEKYKYVNQIYDLFGLKNSYFSIFILFVLFIIILIKNIFLAFFYWEESKFMYQTQEKISKRLFSNLINKDYAFHLKNNSADLITRIRTDSVVIRESIYALFNLIQSIIFISGIMVFLIILEPLGFSITLVNFLILGSLFYKFTSKKTSEIGRIRQEQEIARTKKLQESFSGIKEIKTFLLKNLFIKDYANIANTVAKSYAIRGLINKLPKVFLETLVLVVIIILTLILFEGTSDKPKVFALLSVFAIAAIKIIPHVYSVLNALNIFKFSSKPIHYYKQNLIEKEKNIPLAEVSNLKFKDKIVFKNVYFKYPEKNDNALENLNFEINKGDKIFLKGSTGAGKSTLIDLILGLQNVTSGEIIIDNENIKNLSNKWLSNVSYVPQSIYLFDDTVKNNITLGEDDNDFNESRFFECLRAAELSDFVNSLPNNENSMIGEVGSKISGGQKQRIGIARALYKKSEIMILDEATNALDKTTESKVFKNLGKQVDKTFLIIHHEGASKSFDAQILEIKDKKAKLV
tara:strand:+ start:1149 stop:2855 length:1707 start_codon:yes stop_codon:yes gene_type:complete